MTVPVFTTGEVLTASAMNSVGLWLVKSQTIGTGVSSVTVTSAFSADYDAYKIIISGGVGSTAANVGLNLAGSTTGYYSGGAVFSYSAAVQQNISDNNASSWTRAAQMSTDAINFDVTIVDPFLAKKTKISFIYALVDTAQTGGHGAGFHNVATSYTGFTLTPSSGTFTGGTIRVYGYRN
jgi:hypothetical protein